MTIEQKQEELKDLVQQIIDTTALYDKDHDEDVGQELWKLRQKANRLQAEVNDATGEKPPTQEVF